MNAEYVDILIVGAGLSGIGTAYHLQDKCPTKSYAILEGRDTMGGTWDLFRYPGIRSDSDMYTLGYNFKPWREAKDIADGPSILKYVQETASVEAQQKATGEIVHIRCNVLLMCSGYYSYKGGFTPEFQGREQFAGDIIHPQKWPEDLDYSGKKVVVIGSGATAVTIVPAIAEQAEHVVMLQRSPTYMVARPDVDPLANFLRTKLPAKMAYAITRWRNVALSGYFYNQTRVKPEKMREDLLNGVRNQLGPDYDIDTHFTPSYNPWDQRLCLVPNGDFFQAINDGQASVVTDHIERFTEQGILLKSGETLKADIIITATGLNMILLGGIEFVVDGETVSFPDTYTYKGMMYSDVPNLVTTFGYINASWTLRADLTAEYTCRLINHMDQKATRQFTPRLRAEDHDMTDHPWIQDFSSGYMERVMHLFPKQGDREPWINPQSYKRDKKMIRRGKLEDGALIFDNPI